MKPPSQLEREALASTPSFRKSVEEWPGLFEEEDEEPSLRAGSPGEISAVDPLHGLDEGVHPAEGDDGSGDEFEFAVLSRDSFEGLEPISADDIFSNGRILPIYPLFNRALLVGDVGSQYQDREGGRDEAAAGGGGGEQAEKPPRVPLRKLMLEDREPPSTSSSESDDLEGLPAESYCLWTPSSVPPSPEMRQRSHSTGDSCSMRWRLRDLVIGRSHSDGRKRFLFLAASPKQRHKPAAAAEAEEKPRRRRSADGSPVSRATAEEEKKKGKGKGGVKVLQMDMVTAHRLYYGKGGAAAGDRRRSFLPYREVGLFANVNGGSHHLF